MGAWYLLDGAERFRGIEVANEVLVEVVVVADEVPVYDVHLYISPCAESRRVAKCSGIGPNKDLVEKSPPRR